MDSPLENALMSFCKVEMISFMETHPESFEEAINLALSDKQPYAWRSAFLLWSCIKINDPRIQARVKDIIAAVKNKNDGHQRELIKILLKMELKSKQEGILFNLCMNIWEQIEKKPSVRITALKFILKIVKKYPELSNEINVLMQDHYLQTLSPGVKRSVSKMMKEEDNRQDQDF